MSASIFDPLSALHQRRFGKFEITQKFIAREVHAVKLLFSSIVVVRCECMFDRDAFEYIAASHLFRPVAFGEVTPSYQIHILRSGPLDQIQINAQVEP